jgi:hypothetical protein
MDEPTTPPKPNDPPALNGALPFGVRWALFGLILAAGVLAVIRFPLK